MQYTVKQIAINHEMREMADARGHDAAAAQYPQYRARLVTQTRGSKGYEPEFAGYYTAVCLIQADDLNGVYAVGNLGPSTSITRLVPTMHSVSVGDIIEDPDGTQYMVNSFGFEELN